MEAILQIKVLKDRISRNDLIVKSLLKNIIEDDCDLQQLNHSNEQISSKCDAMRQDLEDYKRLVKVIEDPEIRYQIEKDLDSMQNQFEMNMSIVRKSVINTQKKINTRAREKLFEYTDKLRNRLDPSKNRIANNNNENRANQATTLTENLYSVSRMLANEVEKSDKTLNTLVSSSALATETSEELKTMSNYIANSKTLLSKYGRRELTDKILTMLAFAFFFGCVIYVVVKRLNIVKQ